MASIQTSPRVVARTFLRGFSLVLLVSANTVQIADRHWVGMGIVGFLISLVWWANSSAQRETYRGAGAVYATGAAVGTLVGAGLADWCGR